jgi:alkylation response protein AidB-like acyl-CoA dehydrogenase
MFADLNDDQRALRDLARDVLADACPASAVRRCWESQGELDRTRWARLGAADLLGLTVPERFGGASLGTVEWTVLLEEAGRVALPEPLLEVAGLAPALLLAQADGGLRDRWLPALASGTALVAVQVRPGDPVAHVDSAEAVLVLRDDGLRVLAPDQVTATRVPTMDRGRRLFRLDADLTAAPPRPVPPDLPRRAAALAALGTAATLVGVSAALLDRTVRYVGQRRQFGRAVGSFQAVQHALANCHVMVEMCRPAVWQAGYLLDHDLAAGVAAAGVAKAYASAAAGHVNDVALQCHGGIGFTWEHDLHLWLKRGKALEQAYGSADDHRREVAARLFADEPASD